MATRGHRFVALALISTYVGTVCAQTTSLSRRAEASGGRKSASDNAQDPRNLNKPLGNPLIEASDLTAVKPTPPRTFKVHDLITIIVREQRKFESDGEIETKKKFDVQSQLSALFKPINGTLGAVTFSNGQPNVNLKYKTTLKHEADKEREDRFTTRLTGEVIDVKPNGNLVIQAKAKMAFDNEITVVTLTGTVRSVDVTPDNSVLSTQLADKDIVVHNEGAVRDGSSRGWLVRILDTLRPF